MSLERSVVAVGVLLLGSVLTSAPGLAAKRDKNHRDAFVAGEAEEASLAREIRHQLLMLPYYGVFDDLAFRLDDGTVTLLGQVTRPTLKSDAEQVVKTIPGVQRVVNQIDVLPPSPMDDQIRIAEYRAIYGDPTISTRYGYRAVPPIHIIVKNGNVTLEGVVANEADKEIIDLRAKSVPNVFSVTNNLQVESS
ncbi:MAG: BON domain-containing protein [Acidobacteriota bacterium]